MRGREGQRWAGQGAAGSGEPGAAAAAAGDGGSGTGRAGEREERGPRRARLRSLFVAAARKMAPVLVEKKLLGPDGPGGAELPSEEEEGQNLW